MVGESREVNPDAALGPLVHLHIKEWSVEYDDQKLDAGVTVWVSTDRADYKLVSAEAQYEVVYHLLRRKTAMASRAIALLQETPNLAYKELLKTVTALNNLNETMMQASSRGLHACVGIACMHAGVT